MLISLLKFSEIGDDVEGMRAGLLELFPLLSEPSDSVSPRCGDAVKNLRSFATRLSISTLIRVCRVESSVCPSAEFPSNVSAFCRNFLK